MPPHVGAALDNAACVRCHSTEAEEWRGSQHQTSYIESTFLAAHDIEPRAFCRECHAPQADPASKAPPHLAELGVACVSCHVDDGTFVATSQTSLLQNDSCVGCHEFPFPDNVLRDEPLFMQTTGLEHARSPFADRSCADCHMPVAEDGHRSHSFEASRDPERLRSALNVTAERIGEDTLRLTLRAEKVGHAFPTGDLLRRLEVGAVVVDTETERRPHRRYLARHFGPKIQRNGIRIRSLLRDNRVPSSGARVVDLRFANAAGHEIRWWVQYQRVARHRSPDLRDAALDGVTDLADGVVAPASTSP